MLEGCKQIRPQTSFLLANRIQIPAFQQQSKKTLREIFRLFRSDALSPHKAVDRPPIRAAKFFECLSCCWRFALRFQNHAPVSCCKSDRSVFRTCANRVQGNPVMARYSPGIKKKVTGINTAAIEVNRPTRKSHPQVAAISR